MLNGVSAPPKVLSNLTNYRSFGFSKIIPRLPAKKFEAVVKASALAVKASTLWYKVT